MKIIPAILLMAVTAYAAPNVVLIMADDLGAENCYPYGCNTNVTPNIDSIATDGMMFGNMHSGASCAPSRAMLLTGRDSSRNGVETVSGITLSTNEVTIANVLQDAGIATGVFGKWHLIGEGAYTDQEAHIAYCGFDTNKNYVGPFGQYEDYISHETYGPNIYMQEALGFIEDHAGEQFFCYWSSMIPHAPYYPTPFDTNFTGTSTQYHFNLMEYLDWGVSNVLAKLDSEGIASNTVVIFVGDNGTSAAITSGFNGVNVTGGKNTSDETATWVPFYIKWPGQIQPGSTYDHPAQFVDITTTLADLMEVSMPVDRLIDGRSFEDQLLGDTGKHRRNVIIGKTGSTALESIRNSSHKLFNNNGSFILKDVTKKPFGDINLAEDTLPKILQRIRLEGSYNNFFGKSYGDMPWGELGVILVSTSTNTIPDSPVMTNVAMSGAATMLEGDNTQYTLTGYYDDGGTTDYTSGASWNQITSLSNVTLGATGLVTAGDRDATNSYSFYASYGGFSDTNTISIHGTNEYVAPPPVAQGEYPDYDTSGIPGVSLASFDAFDPPVSNYTVSASAPAVSEWTRTANSTDTIALTGEALASGFVAFGVGVTNAPTVAILDGQECALTLAGLPVDEMYGRNLALGLNDSYLWIEENDLWLTNTVHNPYMCEYTVPPSLTNGTYTIWAHNGKGRNRRSGWRCN